MTTAAEIAKNLKFDKIDSAKTPNLISYSLLNNANGDTWKEIKLIFNGSDQAQSVKIKKANWTVIARDGKIDKNGIGEMTGGNTTVAPHSALILAIQ